jgi:hypothetical protein
LKGRLGAVVLLCVGLAISACTTSVAPRHSVVVPNIIGMSQEAATRHLSDTGLSPEVISGASSSRSPAGTVTGSNPSAGVSVATGAPVSLTVSDGISAPPSTAVAPSTCASGNVAYTPSAEPSSICVRVGSTLTVTFISSGGWSGYGQWGRWPPTISDSSILRGDSWGSSGKTATAVFGAAGTGTATVTASFDVRCAPSDTTPCTVPPEEFHNLTVTVVSA